MESQRKIEYFEGTSFSELYADDIAGGNYAFLLSYPCTAAWSPCPNTRKYYIQDGNVEEKKVGFDKIRQKEPWKIMAVLGETLPGILTSRPPDSLIQYWKDHFGFSYENMIVLPHENWADNLNAREDFEKLITLFPYDYIRPEKHAVDPDTHYRLLSKCSLAEQCHSVPDYDIYDLREVSVEAIGFSSVYHYPYLVKTSHGLSGEGTYIIKNDEDLSFCMEELRIYRRMKLADFIVVMDFVENVADNYCVQFYVDKKGQPKLIGATSQLVSSTGVHLGGVIRFQGTDMTKFSDIILHFSRSMNQSGYFGVVGVDVLEDRDGVLHVIDANIRVNGSTPLCLQRQTLLPLGKAVAKYSTDYYIEDNLDATLTNLKQELDRKDFMILSAVEYPSSSGTRTEIYGIVTGENINEMERTEKGLSGKGLRLME